MATGVVVGSILLAADQQFGVEKLAVVASSDLINGRRVEIDKERTRNMLAAARLGEEGLVGAGISSIGSIGVGTTIGAEAVLEKVAIKIPVSLNGDGKRYRRARTGATYSSQAELPSWVPAWPRWR